MRRILASQSLLAALMMFGWSAPPLAAQQPPMSDSQLKKLLTFIDSRPEVSFLVYISDALKITQGKALMAKGRVVTVRDDARNPIEKHTFARSVRPGDDYIILVVSSPKGNRAFLTARDLRLRAAIEWSPESDDKLFAGVASPSDYPKAIGKSAENLFRAELAYWAKRVDEGKYDGN